MPEWLHAKVGPAVSGMDEARDGAGAELPPVVRVNIGRMLAMFDPAGELPGRAQLLTTATKGREGAAVDAFWDHYRTVAPARRQPSASDLERRKRDCVVGLKTMLADIESQSWVDAMHQYWTLTEGDIDAVTAVRSALSRQYDVLDEAILEQVAEDPGRQRELSTALRRIAALEDCVLGQYIGEVKGAIRDRDRTRISDRFRDRIASGVDQASKLGELLKASASDVLVTVAGMVSMTGELSHAAENSSTMMRDAVETAVGLANAIDGSKREVEVAAYNSSVAASQIEDAVIAAEALDAAAADIGSIIQLIREIAGRSNMLALNATIEAARAGEMGKGFTIVAQEVKSLSKQTAEATDEIATRIAAMQAATTTTVTTSAAIRDAVKRVEDMASRVSEAMVVQAEVVGSIISAVDDTASAAETMAVTIGAIRSNAEEVSAEVVALGTSFKTVNDKLEELRDEAGEYVRMVSEDRRS